MTFLRYSSLALKVRSVSGEFHSPSTNPSKCWRRTVIPPFAQWTQTIILIHRNKASINAYPRFVTFRNLWLTQPAAQETRAPSVCHDITQDNTINSLRCLLLHTSICTSKLGSKFHPLNSPFISQIHHGNWSSFASFASSADDDENVSPKVTLGGHKNQTKKLNDEEEKTKPNSIILHYTPPRTTIYIIEKRTSKRHWNRHCEDAPWFLFPVNGPIKSSLKPDMEIRRRSSGFNSTGERVVKREGCGGKSTVTLFSFLPPAER